MARNEEKAQSMLNRFLKLKGDEDKVEKKRPYLSSLCDSLVDAERWRYQITASKIFDADGTLPAGSGYYKYYGEAKNLPGVKELLAKPEVPITKKSRYDLNKCVDADYYGYRDDDDGTLEALEMLAEKKAIDEAVERWKIEQKEMYQVKSLVSGKKSNSNNNNNEEQDGDQEMEEDDTREKTPSERRKESNNLILGAVLMLCLVLSMASAEQFNFDQRLESSWKSGGVTWSVYSVSVSNYGHDSIITSIISDKAPVQGWGDYYYDGKWIANSWAAKNELNRPISFGYSIKSDKPLVFSVTAIA
eukprot:gene12179-14254_t